MGVKVRKRAGKWYVFVDWQGNRKAKCVGSSREAAETVRREIEKRLALGTFSLNEEAETPNFAEYAERWMSSHVRAHLKPSTIESYDVILKVHLLPHFGRWPIETITRSEVKARLAELVRAGKLARSTVKNIFAILRALFSQAIEDGVAATNPALRLGRFNRPLAEDRKAEFLTRDETERFLEAARDLKPERYALFLTALRSGLRLGELLALEWEDIQFGESEHDQNRYIFVRHNIVRGQATSPKSRKPRRVDLSKELRRVLMEVRDQRILDAIERGQFNEQGQPKIAKLAFPSEAGGPLDSRNVYHRDFMPCLKAAGLRRVTFHALRHTFASLLIQSGASLAYVKEQMGHSSIQVTADVYGHLVPGGNIEWVDRLDHPTSPQQSATPAQPAEHTACRGSLQVSEKNGRRGGTRTPDPRIRNPMLYPTELHAQISLNILPRSGLLGIGSSARNRRNCVGASF